MCLRMDPKRLRSPNRTLSLTVQGVSVCDNEICQGGVNQDSNRDPG
ncbi:hypothetical protein XMM379_000033 [Aliiroseovarius sp. xm-m-379]|nr:hypothetical protein [Aliiroseovarius sp. xm-d-517]NRP23362.1 hypothetical protein [Aliiroseovarius sp. xm-m-379]NRP29368.1 hypothetical protein [Aliiroseovarius sp. xm-m-314]NRP32161.1 hypothetical protein [Aliiroseovarius sp. xm-a-104]NRP42797.1 hypothetical protein [Aliiroseovarius sp. xm-m-339-2]NRP44107.1 hypothetical protein [Aliiroseovarius sp. xm-m-378]NRP48582.1 hypothetical protein [Aliiroseovarius sp. xm-m-354]NRP63687.1 hypothetical protein [Aliiroseovarius sp. xm-a-151]NRP64